jgi:uncharacterized protein YqjF (DUF2071 family)
MRQTWHDLLFAHWPLDPAALLPWIPPPLAVDCFDGRAWLGVVPFQMAGVTPRGVPALPGLSAFAELNVRTYVTAGGKAGVLFFSLDAASRLAVEVARLTYHLPYYRARMAVRTEGETIHYASRRTDPRGRPAELVARYGPAGPVVGSRPGSLDHFLTERYCLYAPVADGRLYRAEIHHAPWPLQPGAATFERNTMAAAAGLTLPSDPPVLHFARRLDVVVWPRRRLGPG